MQLMGADVKFCFFLTNILTLSAAAKTDSHSLWVFATFIQGETPFPEFSAVVMLDDVQIGYYDSNIMRYNRQEHKTLTDVNKDTEQQDAATAFGYIHRGMKYRAKHLKDHFNYTDGILVQQRLAGCEMLNHVFGQTKSKDAFNGIDVEDTHFTESVLENGIFEPNRIWPLMWDTTQKVYCKWIYTNIYHPICVKTLKRYLKEEKQYVMRREKPKVRVFHKQLKDSGGARVSCLATGFYPRHINLKLLRNGQPVSEHLVSGGDLLPNGDGTYQMRKSLEISAEELRQKHNYTCTATHLSLDNKLDIHWDYDPGLPIAVIASTVLLVILVCVIAPIAVFIVWKKRRVVSRTSSQSDYSAASTTEEKEVEDLKN